MKIYITGSTGFVGSNLEMSLKNETLVAYSRGEDIKIADCDVVVHLAGKAHDLKNTTDPDAYYKTNTEFTQQVFDAFLSSNARVFITLSSVKAVADSVSGELREDHLPNPKTHYGKSKLLAEQYIQSQELPEDKRVYILRPCMIHGPGNKGNLNLLYKVVSSGLFWPLGSFENKRSFCSINNLLFIIQEIIQNHSIPSGIYNVADSDSISTNELIQIIGASLKRRVKILRIPAKVIIWTAKIGGFLGLPLNNERLEKLTSSYVVSNDKIMNALGKPLPYSTRDGLIYTLNSFLR